MDLPVYHIFLSKKAQRKLLSNPWSDKPVEAELQIDHQPKVSAALRCRGHHTRSLKKKSYDLLLNEERVETIHLNAEYNDPSLIRNKLSLDFFSGIGVLAPKSEHILLQINGTLEGIYLQLESFDRHFLETRGLPVGPVYYATNDHANFSLLTADHKVKKGLLEGYTRKIGDDRSDQSLKDMISFINTAQQNDFDQKIDDYLDRKIYLLWLAGVVCTQNFDGFIHNYSLYRNPVKKQFEISPWDYDGTWGRDIHGELMEYDYVPIEGYNTLTKRLLQRNSFRKQYQSILDHVLASHFLPEKVRETADELFALIRPWITKDSLSPSIHAFHQEAEIIARFTADRRQYLLNQLSRL